MNHSNLKNAGRLVIFLLLPLEHSAHAKIKPIATYKSKIAIVLNLKDGKANDPNYMTANSFWINQGLELGIEKIKKNDQDIDFEYFNDHGTIEGALDVAEKIKKRADIKLVISGYSSSTSVPLAKKLYQQDLFNVFASAKDAIANKEKHGRLVSDNDHQGKLLIDFAVSGLKSKKPCFIFSLNDGFSLQVKRGILETKNGRNIDIFGYRTESSAELESAVKKCHALKADVILHSGISTSARMLLNFHSRYSNLTPVVGSDGWGDIPKVLSNQTIKNMKTKGLKLYFLYYWDDQPRTESQKKIAQQFQLKYQDTISTITALGHDAAIIGAEFVKEKEKNTTLKMSDFLKNGSTKMDLTLFNKNRILAPLTMNVYEIKTDGSFEKTKEGHYP